MLTFIRDEVPFAFKGIKLVITPDIVFDVPLRLIVTVVPTLNVCTPVITRPLVNVFVAKSKYFILFTAMSNVLDVLLLVVEIADVFPILKELIFTFKVV